LFGSVVLPEDDKVDIKDYADCRPRVHASAALAGVAQMRAERSTASAATNLNVHGAIRESATLQQRSEGEPTFKTPAVWSIYPPPIECPAQPSGAAGVLISEEALLVEKSRLFHVWAVNRLLWAC
jgi:hypothetical protein